MRAQLHAGGPTVSTSQTGSFFLLLFFLSIFEIPVFQEPRDGFVSELVTLCWAPDADGLAKTVKNWLLQNSLMSRVNRCFRRSWHAFATMLLLVLCRMISFSHSVFVCALQLVRDIDLNAINRRLSAFAEIRSTASWHAHRDFMLVCTESPIQVLEQPDFLPQSTSGRHVQTKTFLGPFLSASVLPSDDV